MMKIDIIAHVHTIERLLSTYCFSGSLLTVASGPYQNIFFFCARRSQETYICRRRRRRRRRIPPRLSTPDVKEGSEGEKCMKQQQGRKG